ncbi:glycoside hydrolase family 78 protein [Xylariaceae sp. AK1471]|nr:glycoside hydrolase family 78 protein [Xylariaceae sp. AK1471]
MAGEIRDTFNQAFYNEAKANSTDGANVPCTQASQALALDAGLVPDGCREQILNTLVELTYSQPSGNGLGPHLSGGTIGMSSIVQVLSASGRDDVRRQAPQQNDKSSYGCFIVSTAANPRGFITIPEDWKSNDSLDRTTLAQINEWLHAGVAGIRPTPLSTISYAWEDRLVFQPKPVGDLTSATGSFG